MSTFHIDNEIDNLVDKLTDQFKTRLKKIVRRSEKLILKQYIASQRETMRATRGTRFKAPKPKSKPASNITPNIHKTMVKSHGKTNVPRREKDYSYEEFGSSSDDE